MHTFAMVIFSIIGLIGAFFFWICSEADNGDAIIACLLVGFVCFGVAGVGLYSIGELGTVVKVAVEAM